MQTVEVEIYGRKFRLRSDDPSRTLNIVDSLNEQINELVSKYQDLDFTKLLLLNSLQQQECLLDLKDKNITLSTDLDRLNQMISKFIGET
jgi:cell division protein ZapA (FtsZ GTPase activity inhibitor)